MTMRWQSRDPWQSLSLMLAPTWDPCVAFRFRNDDGSETSATWIAAENANGIEITPDQNFRLRIISQMTNAGDQTEVAWQLQYRVNGGTWTLPTTTLSTPVRMSASPHVNHSTATTKQLAGGSGSFITGWVATTFRSGNTNAIMTSGSHVENEWCLNLNGGTLQNGDEVEFRVLQTSTAHTQTHTPKAVVLNANAAVAPTLLTPEADAEFSGSDFTWQFNTDNVDFGVVNQEAFAFMRVDKKAPDPEGPAYNLDPDPSLSAPNAGYGCAWSPDGSLLAISHGGSPGIRIFNTSDWSEISNGPSMPATSSQCHFNHDGSLLAASCAAGAGLYVFDTSDWSVVENAPTFDPAIYVFAVEFSPDGNYLAIGNRDQAPFLVVLDTSTWEPVTLPSADVPTADLNQVRWSPDSRYIATAGFGATGNTGFRVFDRNNSWSLVPDLVETTTVWQLTWSPDGTQFLLASSASQDLLLFDFADQSSPVVSTWQPGINFLLPQGLWHSWSASGFIVTSNRSETTTIGRVWHISEILNGTHPHVSLFDFPYDGNAWTAAISPDEQYVAVVWETGDAKRAAVFETGIPSWWNGTEFQSTEHFIVSGDESVEIPLEAWYD